MHGFSPGPFNRETIAVIAGMFAYLGVLIAIVRSD